MLSELTIWYIIGIIWMGILMVVSSICLVIVVYRLCIEDSSTWIDTVYRNLTVITMIAFLCNIITDFIHVLVHYISTPNELSVKTSELIILIISDTFYYSANVLFYILLLSRIKVVFGLNNCIYNVLRLGILCSIIGSIFYLFLIMLTISHPIHDYVGYNILGLSIIDLLLNTTLFIIFWRKMRNSITGEAITKDYQNKVNMITNILIKHCVLFGIAIIANQMYFIYKMCDDLIHHQHTVIIDRIFKYSVRVTENTINIMVLALILRIYYNQYICLCKYCHLCVGKCCMKNDNTNIINPYSPLHDL